MFNIITMHGLITVCNIIIIAIQQKSSFITKPTAEYRNTVFIIIIIILIIIKIQLKIHFINGFIIKFTLTFTYQTIKITFS